MKGLLFCTFLPNIGISSFFVEWKWWTISYSPVFPIRKKVKRTPWSANPARKCMILQNTSNCTKLSNSSFLSPAPPISRLWTFRLLRSLLSAWKDERERKKEKKAQAKQAPSFAPIDRFVPASKTILQTLFDPYLNRRSDFCNRTQRKRNWKFKKYFFKHWMNLWKGEYFCI